MIIIIIIIIIIINNSFNSLKLKLGYNPEKRL